MVDWQLGQVHSRVVEGSINLAAMGELLRQGPEASLEFAERLDGKSSTDPLPEHKAQVDKTLPKLSTQLNSCFCLLSTTSCKMHLYARLRTLPPPLPGYIALFLRD